MEIPMPEAMIFLWSSTTVAEISNKLQKYFGHILLMWPSTSSADFADLGSVTLHSAC
jgi:hypothetical protein